MWDLWVRGSEFGETKCNNVEYQKSQAKHASLKETQRNQFTHASVFHNETILSRYVSHSFLIGFLYWAIHKYTIHLRIPSRSDSNRWGRAFTQWNGYIRWKMPVGFFSRSPLKLNRVNWTRLRSKENDFFYNLLFRKSFYLAFGENQIEICAESFSAISSFSKLFNNSKKCAASELWPAQNVPLVTPSTWKLDSLRNITIWLT